MFYTNPPNSGIIPLPQKSAIFGDPGTKPKSIGDYRKGIDDLSKKIAELNKGQYKAMLSGDDKKTSAMDKFIADAEKLRDDLRVQLSRAMGIGSENKGKDLLRQADTSGSISNRPQFKANNMQKSVGIDDSETNSGGDTSGGGSGGGGHSWGDSGQEDEEPIPLKIPGTFKDYVNRDDYSNIDDYNSELEEHAQAYLDKGDKQGLDEFLSENGEQNNIFLRLWINNYPESKHESLLDMINKKNVLKGYISAPPGPFPPLDEEKGSINIDGKGIPVVPWSGQYEDYSDKVVKSYFTHRNDFNFAKFFMGSDTVGDIPEDGSKENDLFKKDEKTVQTFSGLGLLMDTLQNVFSSVHSFDVITDVVNIDGQQRAIIKYYDSVYNFDHYKIGPNPFNLDTGVQITLDEKRRNNYEFGYIYVDNGKTMLRPLVYPGDKFLVNGEDITYEAMKPVELPKELVKEINDMLNQKGLYIDLPY